MDSSINYEYRQINGIVTVDGSPAAREVLLIKRVIGNNPQEIIDQTISDSGDGSFSLVNLSSSSDAFVVILDDYGTLWTASNTYQVDDIVHPSVPNGYVYKCTVGGTSDATEPTWPTSSTVVDNGVTWDTVTYYEPICHGPYYVEFYGVGQNPILEADHPNLVLFHTMDNTLGSVIYDESNAGNDGSMTDVTFDTGADNQGAVFNGTSAWIDSSLRAHLASFTQPWTISFWCKDWVNGSGYVIHTEREGTSIGDMGIVIDSDIPNITLQHLGSSPWITVYNSTETMISGEWNHVLVILDRANENYEIWVNGVQTTFVANGTIADDGFYDKIEIARNRNYIFNTDFISISLDQLRIFDRVLDTDEINALYNEISVDSTPLILRADNPDLAIFYTMDNTTGATINDESVNAANGTMYNITHESGKNGAATVYNGSSSYIDCGNAFNLGTFACSFWIKSTTNEVRIIDTRGTGSIGTVQGWQIKTRSTDTTDMFVIDDGVNYINMDGVKWSGNYTDGNWHHIVAMYEDATKTMTFIMDNGTPYTETNNSMGSVLSSQPCYIGHSSNNSGIQQLNGSVDQLRIFNRVLTAEEITTLYEEFDAVEDILADNHPDLLVYYPMTKEYNNKMIDHSISDNDGTLSSTGWTVDNTGATQSGVPESYLDIGTGILSSAMTVSFWYNTIGDNGSHRTLVCKEGGSQHHCLIQEGTGILGFWNGGMYASPLTPANDTDYHILFTISGSNYELFVDGSSIFTSSSFFDTNTYALKVIGNRTISGGTQQMNGRMWNFRVFNRVLTQDEIDLLYSEGGA